MRGGRINRDQFRRRNIGSLEKCLSAGLPSQPVLGALHVERVDEAPQHQGTGDFVPRADRQPPHSGSDAAVQRLDPDDPFTGLRCRLTHASVSGRSAAASASLITAPPHRPDDGTRKGFQP